MTTCQIIPLKTEDGNRQIKTDSEFLKTNKISLSLSLPLCVAVVFHFQNILKLKDF